MSNESDSTTSTLHPKGVEPSDKSVTLKPNTPSDGDSERNSIDKEKAEPANNDHVYPPTRKVIPVMGALYIVIFLVSLDRTILATAIPHITDQFNSIADIGWYGSAFFLTGCSFQLLVGKIYTIFSAKWVYLIEIFIFELGSLISGVAKNSTTLIIGRAISGVGVSGIMSGTAVIVVHMVPLRKRPTYMGLMGAMFGVASVAGPLLGGAFSDKVSWRWCFYINLPFGAIAMAAVFFLVDIKSPSKEKWNAMSLQQKIVKFDPLGTAFFLPSIVCLLLALQWGGVKYPWSNGRIIALFVLFGLLMIAFIAVQIWRKEEATVPPRIFVQRTVLGASLFTFCAAGAMMVVVYYLPIWFQAIKGVNAVKSSVMNIPLLVSMVITVAGTGGLVSAVGYYNPFILACSVISSIGAGLLTTFTTSTNHDRWIGYQVIFGFGLGIGMQQGSVAVQTVLPKVDVPIGISLNFFAQQLGGTIAISIAENIFTNKLQSGLSMIRGLPLDGIMNVGATGIRDIVKDSGMLHGVLEVYNKAVVDTFYVSVALAGLGIFGAAAIEWKNVKRKDNQ